MWAPLLPSLLSARALKGMVHLKKEMVLKKDLHFLYPVPLRRQRVRACCGMRAEDVHLVLEGEWELPGQCTASGRPMR